MYLFQVIWEICYKNNGWNCVIFLLINLDLGHGVHLGSWYVDHPHVQRIQASQPVYNWNMKSFMSDAKSSHYWECEWVGGRCASLTWFQGNIKKKPFYIPNLYIYPYLMTTKILYELWRKIYPYNKAKDGLSLHSVFAYMKHWQEEVFCPVGLTSAEVEYWISFRRIFVDTLKINMCKIIKTNHIIAADV